MQTYEVELADERIKTIKADAECVDANGDLRFLNITDHCFTITKFASGFWLCWTLVGQG